jgi:hypothetical protein
MRKIFILASIAMLGACANTGVVQMERGTYIISKDSAKFGGGISQAVRIEVYQEANAFCSKNGKFVETQDLLMAPGVPGRLGNVTLQFKCIDSPEGKAIHLQRTPDSIIEIRHR